MSQDKIGRRDFFGKAAVAFLGIQMIPSRVLGRGGVAPSGKINMAIIGNGLISGGHRNHFAWCPQTQVLALCDVHKGRLDSAKKHVDSVNKRRSDVGQVPVFTTEYYQEILDRDDVDAVTVCTPDHWHVQIALKAIQAGKAVYVEKPMSLTIEEGRILADDLGYGDIGCMGAKNFKTPNIDSLASNGIVFSQGYATASTCTPSRYSMLTGEYAWRQKGKKTVILDGNDPLCIPQGAFTLPKIFKAAGYRTAAIGKWHLGLGDGSKELDFNSEITPNPNSVGFDYSYIIPATVDRVPSVWLKNGRVENLDPTDPITVSYSKNISDTPTGAERPDLLKQGADAQHSGSIINGISRIGYMRGGKAARFVDEQIPNVVVSQAAKFIDSNKNNPFFLYVGLFEPHVPRTVDKRFEGASQCGIRGDAIVQADWQVGEIVKKLKDEGIYENTVIIFSSDNGPVLFDGYFDNSENETNGHSPSGILRGGKYLIYEGGMRVPFIVVNPDAIKNGLSSEMVGLNDLPATFAKKLGIPVPKGAAFDSIDVSAAFESADGKSIEACT